VVADRRGRGGRIMALYPLYPHGAGPPGHGSGRTGRPHARHRFRCHGRGGHGVRFGPGRLCRLLLLPLGNIVVETGYNVLILAIAVCIVGGLGSWIGAVLAAFLIGFAQILTTVYLGHPFSDGGGLAGHHPYVDYPAVRSFRPSEGIGRKGVTVNNNQRRKERLDRGVKVRTDGIYALMSWRELAYLSIPRLVLIVGMLLLPLVMPGMYWQRVISIVCIYACWRSASIFWPIMWGWSPWAGPFFVGVGGYAAAILNTELGLPPLAHHTPGRYWRSLYLHNPAVAVSAFARRLLCHCHAHVPPGPYASDRGPGHPGRHRRHHGHSTAFPIPGWQRYHVIGCFWHSFSACAGWSTPTWGWSFRPSRTTIRPCAPQA
jgi:hypothetical protein